MPDPSIDPLAFVFPKTVKTIIDGSVNAGAITELAMNVPLSGPNTAPRVLHLLLAQRGLQAHIQPTLQRDLKGRPRRFALFLGFPHSANNWLRIAEASGELPQISAAARLSMNPD